MSHPPASTTVRYPSSNPIQITKSNNVIIEYIYNDIKITFLDTYPANCTLVSKDGPIFDPKYFNLIVSSSSQFTLTLKPQIFTISAQTGSLNIVFNDADNNPLETFQAIPGELDTSMLANGDYADVVIPIIFEKLNNFIYPESIFDNIKYVLTASFASQALAQRIITRVQELIQRIVSGEITIDQFHELVQQGNKDFSDEYGADYARIFMKLHLAIQK